jgi:thioredoxin reductase (NADPH)
MDIEKVIIIGGGPAGITAAIQLARYGIKSVIIEKNSIGGLLLNANLIENYPGFPDGIAGTALVELFAKQLDKHKIDICNEIVFELDYKDSCFEIKTPKNTYKSQIVLIATGTQPNEINSVEIPTDTITHVFYEVYPLLDKSDKTIAIVGAGDAAFDYALNLARHNSVSIFNRGEDVKCLDLLKRRADESENISYRDNISVAKIKSGTSSNLRIYCNQQGKSFKLDVDYLIFAVGRNPALDFLSNNLIEQRAKLEKVGLLHFAGDIKHGIYRQTAIAAGDGLMVAMKIYKKLREQCK